MRSVHVLSHLRYVVATSYYVVAMYSTLYHVVATFAHAEGTFCHVSQRDLTWQPKRCTMTGVLETTADYLILVDGHLHMGSIEPNLNITCTALGTFKLKETRYDVVASHLKGQSP